MNRVRLQVVPAPRPGIPTLLGTGAQHVADATDAVVYECGACEAEVFGRDDGSPRRRLTVQCWRCGAFNRTDPALR